ncbi:MAG: sulfotransferase [Gammaproteobacteria bacterium]|nr:sulfotransferase [Gammaproteobacteria bacterium]
MLERNLDVIIIGAPRSGTNMLRDVLTSIQSIGSWPCDEINYIWRHGNVRFPSDELPPEAATPKVKKYIRAKFEAMRRELGADVLVEKTCANSLRVAFVDEVIPDAKYLFIYRNGIDATASAKLRWTAKLDIPYIWEKVRFVPKSDLPYYAMRYFWSRLYRFVSKENRLAFWGPALGSMQVMMQRYDLEEVCALQWQKCVENSEKAFASIAQDRVHRICYEEFVQSPQEELRRILDFIGRDVSADLIEQAVAKVSPKNMGKGRQVLGFEKVKKLEQLVGATLKQYGYL